MTSGGIILLAALSVQPSAFVDRMKKQFKEAVIDLCNSQDRLLVIVIDNAQDLPVQTISELRYLLNFEIDSKSMLCLILVGQPELRDTLKLRTFEPVSQCITAQYRIPPLDEGQTKEYIAHQLKLSEMPMLFPDDVIRRIHQFTCGIPRLINNICRHCLIDLDSNKLELVDNQVLDRVLRNSKTEGGWFVMDFRCSYRWEDGKETWTGKITKDTSYGSHHGIQIQSRSSIRVLVGKSSSGLFACMPDFEVGCHQSAAKQGHSLKSV